MASSAEGPEKKEPFIPSNAAVVAAESGHAGDDGGVRISVVVNFGGKANLGIDLDDIGQSVTICWRASSSSGRRVPRERGRHSAVRRKPAQCSIRGVTKIASNRPRAREALVGQILQADAERKHGDERGHADGDAERGERIAQQGFAQIAERRVR